MPAAKQNQTTSVVIADQHSVTRWGVRAVLGRQRGFRVVGEASNGREALRLVKKHDPDVLITDIKMLKLNGLSAARQLLDQHSRTQVLILTAVMGEYEYHMAMQAEVSGYLLKSDEIDGLPAAVRKIHQGGTSYAKEVEEYFKIHRRDPKLRRNFTPREDEVFQLVGEYCTTKEIAEELKISTKTVEVFVTSLMKKLRIHSRLELAAYAASTGITGN